jgi:xanthine dehydrogenase accessory factor
VIALFEEILALSRAGRPFAIVTVVETRRSTPRKPGSKMVVLPDGSIRGSVGGGALEAETIQEALRLLREGAGEPADHEAVVRRFTLRREGEDAVGMYCGGEVHVLIEAFRPAERLFLFGAGHVGRAIASHARDLGMPLTVVDDRREYLSPEAFPDGATLVLTDREYRRDLPLPGRCDFAVVATRCHDTDEKVLHVLLGEPPRYLGMIASRAKAATVLAHLRRAGVPEDALARVRSPMGLPIGSHTPAEVAISVLAEIVAIRNGAVVEPGARGERSPEGSRRAVR